MDLLLAGDLLDIPIRPKARPRGRKWTSGQDRTEWLQSVSDDLGDFAEYYLGPAMAPLNAAGAALSYTDAGDFVEAGEASRDFVNALKGVGNKMPLLRDPYQGEDAYFKANPTVSGMATEDGRVILNPYSDLSDQERASVYQNEALRLHMRNSGYSPDFAITDNQRAFFAGTPYEGNEDQMRQTIIARILSGDPSAGDVTPEQRAAAQSVMSDYQGQQGGAFNNVLGPALRLGTAAAAMAVPFVGARMGDDLARWADDFVGDEEGAIFGGDSVDEVLNFVRNGRPFYHSGSADVAEDIHKWGVEPQSGDWVMEVLRNAADEDMIDDVLDAPAAAWWSEAPDWVRAKVARAAKKHVSEVTDDDVRQFGHLAIADADDWGGDVYRVGEDGLSNGEYSNLTTLDGDEVKLYETPLYDFDTRGRYPFGIERNELVTGESIDPKYSLTGDELVEFLNRYNAPTDPATQRGQEILDLLTSGRASEVTDDMLDMGDPVQNARLNMYLYDNYDLPMDEMSRADRQYGMGFGENPETYHGTGDDFVAFNAGFRPDGKGGSFNSGVYSAYRPQLAESYAPKISGGQIMPIATKNTHHSVVVSAPGENWNMLPEGALVTSNIGGPHKLGDIYPGAFDMPDNPGRARTNSVAREAGRDGAGSVKFEGIYDQGGFTDLNDTMRHIPPQDIRTDLYPHNIRSRFARFDPRLAHLRNLSAGVGGVGMYNALSTEDQRKEEIRNYLRERQ